MKLIIAASAAALALAPISAAQAGPYTDELNQCLTKATTPADQLVLVGWIFGAISAHPVFKDYSKITPAQRDDMNKEAAALVQRLLIQDCRQQTIGALRHEGLDSFRTAFESVGRMAMQTLMGDPNVQANLDGLTRHFDQSKLEALGKEAASDTGPEPTQGSK